MVHSTPQVLHACSVAPWLLLPAYCHHPTPVIMTVTPSPLINHYRTAKPFTPMISKQLSGMQARHHVSILQKPSLGRLTEHSACITGELQGCLTFPLQEQVPCALFATLVAKRELLITNNDGRWLDGCWLGGLSGYSLRVWNCCLFWKSHIYLIAEKY